MARTLQGWDVKGRMAENAVATPGATQHGGKNLQGGDMKARSGKKRVVLELGGNAAMVLEDFRGPTELEANIPKLTFRASYQSGQSCSLRLQRLCVQPYGGVKESGLGRGGVRWAMQDMTEERVLMLASVGVPHSF